MALVNHSVTNLINGVSEQAPSVRLDNQLEEQINCFSDVTRGLTKRNGLELKQITQLDIEDRFKITFTIDGIKHMVALDANDGVTPLKYVPLSTDVDALAVAINESQYFKEMSRGDLQVIEDKEKVYLLNRRQIVGGASSRATYFDIKLIRQNDFTTPTTWDTGEYTITIDGVADPDHVPLQVAAGQVVVTVDRAKTLQQIADDINAVTALTDETGPCTVSGTISNYRISFNSIPTGYIYPTTVTVETTAITEGFDVFEDSGWIGNSSNRVLDDYDPSYEDSRWFFGGSLISSSGNSNSITVGGYTYYKGSLWRTSYASGDLDFKDYKIKRTRTVSTQYDYEVETTSPSTLGSSGTDITTKAMIWVTGVSADQTYDTTITYYDVTTPMTLLTHTSSTAVGTTPSNIRLNYVATDIKNDYDGHADFSAVVYDNAVLVTVASGFAISKVETTNNYDITSINGVVEAIQGNKEGIKTIETLPPSFADDFKVRVSSESNDKSNYYMTYDSDFKGWKEAGLDESRFIDFTTMPYVIDKTKTKESGIVTIEPSSWAQALAGDEQSNVDPSFVGRTINDMFFYGSRLGFATDDTLALSEIDEHDTFYRTTTSQTKTSDRVDIKLDSSKIGYDPIKHVITYDGKLFLNTGSNQSILLVNNAFELTSARLSEVSSYSLGDNKPIPVGSGLYFANTTQGVTNVFNYVPSANNKYEAIEMTKHCPKYLKGDFKDIAYSSDVAVVSTFDDKKVLYVQNRYSQGSQMLQNAWHKWVLPFDVEHFYFDNNVLFIIMSSFDDGEVNKYTIVTQYDLKPQEVELIDDEIYIGWTPFVDCYTKDKSLIETFSEFGGVNDKSGVSFDTVQEAYDSTERTQQDLVGSNTDDVVWGNKVNVTATGNTLEKTGGVSGAWDAGAFSDNSIASGDADLEFSIYSITGMKYMIGFSVGDTDQNYPDVDFGVHQDEGQIYAFYQGALVFNGPLISIGDRIKLAVESGSVVLYRNDMPIYTFASAASYPLGVDTSIFFTGNRIENVIIHSPAPYDGTNPIGPYFSKSVTPLYYWKTDGNLNTIIWNDGTPITFGNNTLTEYDIGGYKYLKGDTDDGTGHFEVSRLELTESTYYLDEMLYGVDFKSDITLSQVVPRQQTQEGFTTFNYATLMLRRMRLLLSKSGLFNVTVDFKDRTDYVTKYTGLPLGEFVVGRGTVSDINFNFPINGKSDRVEIRLETQDSTPFNLLSTEWQGQLIRKGRNV